MSIRPPTPGRWPKFARDYSAKYRGLSSLGLFELGLVFASQARNLVQADWRRVE